MPLHSSFAVTQNWHFCTTSNANKLDVVMRGINFNVTLHLS